MQDQQNNLEVEIEILPTGDLRFSRDIKEEVRDFLLNILSNILEDDSNHPKIKEIQDFLDGANDIDLILGENILCG